MTDEKTSTLTPAMKIVIGVVVVLVIAGGITVSALLSGGAAPNTASAPDQSTTSSAGTGAAAGTGGTPSTTPTIGPLPQGTPTTGSEVLPPTATPNTKLPKITPQPPLVPAPLPKTASKTNGIVKGFPKNIMGPAGDSTVLSSSIATEKKTMQVSLVATTTSSQEAIQKHYEKLWASLDMQRGMASDGTLTYAGTYESVALSFGTTGTGNRYTIYGVFRTK